MSAKILSDVQFHLVGGGADDGSYTAGTPAATYKFDRVSYRETRSTADASTAKEAIPIERIVKRSFVMEFETKVAGVAILPDTVLSLTPGGADDLVYNAGTPINNVNFDRLSIEIMRQLSDKSTRQDEIPMMRRDKQAVTFSYESKFEAFGGNAGVSNLLHGDGSGQGQRLVGYTVTTTFDGSTITMQGVGLVNEHSYEYDEILGTRFSLAPYGTDITVTDSGANTLIDLLAGNTLVRARARVTGDQAADVDVTGIIERVRFEFSEGGLMVNFTLAPYGISPLFDFDMLVIS